MTVPPNFVDVSAVMDMMMGVVVAAAETDRKMLLPPMAVGVVLWIAVSGGLD